MLNNKLLKVFIVGITVLATIVLFFGVGTLVIDIGPSIVAYVLNTNWLTAGYIAALGVSTMVFCKVIGKPFDAAMDSIYPDDVKPK